MRSPAEISALQKLNSLELRKLCITLGLSHQGQSDELLSRLVLSKKPLPLSMATAANSSIASSSAASRSGSSGKKSTSSVSSSVFEKSIIRDIYIPDSPVAARTPSSFAKVRKMTASASSVASSKPNTTVNGQSRDASPVTCSLCEGDASVWSEDGLVSCPFCVSLQPIPPQNVKADMIPSHRPTHDEIKNCTRRKDLIRLVKDHGYGLYQSFSALAEFSELDQALAFLRNESIRIADLSRIVDAQLLSEASRDRDQQISLHKGEDLYIDLLDSISGQSKVESLLESIKSFSSGKAISLKFIDFVRHMVSQGRLLQQVDDSFLQEYVTTLYDYLTIRVKCIRWYKVPATAFFDGVERKAVSEQSHRCVVNHLQSVVWNVQEAVFSAPLVGGSVPSIFAENTSKDEHRANAVDDEVTCVIELDASLRVNLQPVVDLDPSV